MEADMQAQLDVLNRKLDLVLDEIELQRRHRQEMDDLNDDLMRVGKDAYRTAVAELEDMHDSLSTAELLHLGKKMLRNVGTIAMVVDQLESLKDFLIDAAPLARESAIDFMQRLDDFDRKGYFTFLREAGNVMDHVVTHFSPEDVKALGDNMVTILNTVRNLTQPDMLGAINNAVSVYKKLDIEVSGDIGLFALAKELRSPEMRRGLAFLMAFVKSLADSGNTPESPQT